MWVKVLPLALTSLACSLHGAEIPTGTHILLRMVNSISSKTARPGDRVYLTTAFPVAVDGRIVVPVNSYVQGVVTHAKPSGRVRGRAQLGIRLDTLTLPDGNTFRFSPVLDSLDGDGTGGQVERAENLVRQQPERGRDAAEVAVLAGAGAAIGGLADRGWTGAGIGAGAGTGVGIAKVLLTRGKEAHLTPGTTLDVVLDRALSLAGRP
ncbi:MAG: hypothetical protein KIT09_26670 [Bryobacteraceae bacterium]|nr:hypothetical protein [Bryobacteraceae bacterium]